MANLLFLDCETTGLSGNSSVIETAIIPYIDGERRSHYQSYIRPHDGATLDPEAFKVNKIDVNKLCSFPSAETVIGEIISFIDSHECVFSLAGHNLSFDSKMLFNLFCRNGRYGDYLTRIRPGGVCTFEMAKNIYKGKKNRPEGFSLSKLCKYHDIELKKAHSALPDIEATIELYEQLLLKIPPINNVGLEKMDYQSMKRKFMGIEYVQMNPDGDVFLTKEAMSNEIIRRFIFTELDSIYE
jgi:DNA polymerase III epsilon subunit-like protein